MDFEKGKEIKDSVENSVKFMDSIAKALEGLRDKFDTLLSDGEARSEKPEEILEVK